jgi:hypothetical protein
VPIVRPSAASGGERITIRAKFGFRAEDFQSSGALLKVDGQSMAIVYYSTLSIVAEMPTIPRTTTSEVAVTLVQGSWNVSLGSVTWLANVPTITSIEPPDVLSGMSITLRGTGLTDITNLNVLGADLPIQYQSANVVVARFTANPTEDSIENLVITRASDPSPLLHPDALNVYPLPSLSFTGSTTGNAGTTVPIALSRIVFGDLDLNDAISTGRLGPSAVSVSYFGGDGASTIGIRRPVTNQQATKLTIDFNNGVVVSSTTLFTYTSYPLVTNISTTFIQGFEGSLGVILLGQHLLCGSSQLDSVEAEFLRNGEQEDSSVSVISATNVKIQFSIEIAILGSIPVDAMQLFYDNGCRLRIQPDNFIANVVYNLTQFAPGQVSRFSSFTMTLPLYPEYEPVLLDRAAVLRLYFTGTQTYSGQDVSEPKYAPVEVYRPNGRLTTVKDNLILLPKAAVFEFVPATARPGDLVALKGLNIHIGSPRVLTMSMGNVRGVNVESSSWDTLMMRLPLGLSEVVNRDIELVYDDGSDLSEQSAPLQLLSDSDLVSSVSPSSVQAAGTISFIGIFTIPLSGYYLDVPGFFTTLVEGNASQLVFQVLAGSAVSTSYRLVHGDHDRVVTTEAEHAITFTPAPLVLAIVEGGLAFDELVQQAGESQRFSRRTDDSSRTTF